MTGRRAAPTPTLMIRCMSMRWYGGAWTYLWASPDSTEREAPAIAVNGADVVDGRMVPNGGSDFDQSAYIWVY